MRVHVCVCACIRVCVPTYVFVCCVHKGSPVLCCTQCLLQHFLVLVFTKRTRLWEAQGFFTKRAEPQSN